MARLIPALRSACAAVMLVLCASATAACAAETAPQDLTVTAADALTTITLFPGRGEGKRPAVILLHGAQGIERFAAAYTRYAEALAAKGIDALLVSYYDAADIGPMRSADKHARESYFFAHLPKWSARIRDVVSFVARRESFSGKVGLLGFSNGGFLAVASAASDRRIDALVVFYAGIAGEDQAGPTRLPPLLALHGDADHNVPLSSGKALLDRAKALGNEANLVVYPGMGHGFDFDATRPESADALARTASFFLERLR
ncbi:putative carboxymethylenebutenolidase [Bradyrhizobium oligotrophicum S58]|uniref:Putative carboxymethylenebutenolidase n=2 Tax=Bradyrhizobium oligotrophicum TaxID=44255 RepID=M4Z7F3_9BRAD|nr:putative carboxymethylenebutenolidase [Bradyrhizobium oligotrophicum S58]